MTADFTSRLWTVRAVRHHQDFDLDGSSTLAGETNLVNGVFLMAKATSTSMSGSISARESTFRTNLEARDQTCLFTHTSALFCDAAHIIGHAKEPHLSSIPLNRFVEQADTEDETLSDIDSIRNGMLISMTLHRVEKYWGVIKVGPLCLLVHL